MVSAAFGVSRVPAGGEYQNVKCKNRSPGLYDGGGACYVFSNGDVVINSDVYRDSYGRISPWSYYYNRACFVESDGYIYDYSWTVTYSCGNRQVCKNLII